MFEMRLDPLARGFGAAVALTAPGLEKVSPFNARRTGGYEW
jgi:hypothetical protein